MTIKAGSTDTEFVVHKPLICVHMSRFFNAWFERIFREALKRREVDAKPECNKKPTFVLCFDLYIFAEVHEVSDLQDETIDVLVDKRDRL